MGQGCPEVTGAGPAVDAHLIEGALDRVRLVAAPGETGGLGNRPPEGANEPVTLTRRELMVASSLKLPPVIATGLPELSTWCETSMYQPPGRLPVAVPLLVVGVTAR